MPELEPPTLPRNEVPDPPPEDPPTIPHSLAPLSGSNAERAGGTEGSESAWSDVWRRRWLVAGAAVVAFLSALAFGRLSTTGRTTVPLPTVSGASLPPMADVRAPAELATAQAALPSGESPPSPAATAATTATPIDTSTPVVDSETLEIPPTEVPPANGTVRSGKTRTRRVGAPSSAAPPKRFMPGAI